LELAPFFDQATLEELRPSDACLELVELSMLGVVGTVTISELRSASRRVQARQGKARACVVVLEEALGGLSKEGVFQRVSVRVSSCHFRTLSWCPLMRSHAKGIGSCRQCCTQG
jgi:hypothetical protein